MKSRVKDAAHVRPTGLWWVYWLWAKTFGRGSSMTVGFHCLHGHIYVCHVSSSNGKIMAQSRMPLKNAKIFRDCLTEAIDKLEMIQ
jgi:hypothetical protein